MERIRSSLPDRPRLSLPDRAKFHLPDRSKFHLPDRPRFNIKKPNVHFPTLGKFKKTQNVGGQIPRERSDESSVGSRRNIFDFSTYPRFFDKKSKIQGEYATSSPKESRAQSTESSTLPRAKKTVAPLGPRWSQKFTDIKFADDEEDEVGKTLVERSKPWRRPSLEQPRLSLGAQESIDEPESLPWEDSEEKAGEMGRSQRRVERVTYEEEEEEGEGDERQEEIDRGRGLKFRRRNTSEDSYEDEPPPRIDPRLYGDQDIRREEAELEEDDSMEMMDQEAYRAAFMAVDPRYYKRKRGKSNETEPETSEPPEGEEDEPLSSGMEEDLSGRSDREQQQSSGSSFDRRRRGIVEEVDSDEFMIREDGLNRDDAAAGRYLTSEIREALAEAPANALADEILMVTAKPPQRPARTRSLRKRKETSVESYEVVGPVRPKRDMRGRSYEADYDYEVESIPDNAEDSFGSGTRHRIVYHAESSGLDLARMEPLDEPLVVVKPLRRKSKSSFTGSQSLRRSESLAPQPKERGEEKTTGPSAPPRRRKRVEGPIAGSRDEVEAPRVNGVGACNGHHFPVSIEPEIAGSEERTKTAAPKKPERATSRETLKSTASSRRIEHEYMVESPPPVPPKRSSRSRGASLAPDDDRTSHGAESIPEIGYNEEDIPQDEEDSRLEYPGYAFIEKREKPPRPPPPRKRRDEKFATTPRPGKTPNRPQRAYSTLRPVRSTTPSEVTVPSNVETEATAYEQVDSELEDEDERRVPSGTVVSMIQGRPLPAPPRPPRSRRERNLQEAEVVLEDLVPMSEAFASTQTDPLPDDMIIEEEVTRAKLIVSPSRSGSQILVSTERIPSPTMANFSIGGTRSYSQGAPSTYDNDIPSLTEQNRQEYSKSSEFPNETSENTIQQRLGAERFRRTPSPGRRATAPTVPPLPAEKSWSYRDDVPVEGLGSPDRELVSRSPSPALLREIARKRDDYEADIETRLQSSLSERIRLEEELERARNLRSALLANEPLKIASLEVTDLKVENLNVTTLEAQKLTASEIDALIVSASEISNKGQVATVDDSLNLQPTLLRELMAIRSQLELANSSSHEAAAIASELAIERMERERRREEQQQLSRPRESSPASHLQLDQVSRTTETRAIYSSLGASREPSSPQPSIQSHEQPAPKKPEVCGKEEVRSRSRSRSSSTGRTASPTGPRQTASPVKSLPPVISVTPDTPAPIQNSVDTPSEMSLPQRAVLSYVQQASPRPPPASPSITANAPRYVTFATNSEIPPEFFALASPSLPPAAPARTVLEPGVFELGQQLLQAFKVAIKRAMRHFVGYIVNRIGHEETDTKMREVEIALCALLLIIVGLLIVCFSGPRTITHHHHWDYFNPPRL